jgi:hypothetical protein
LVQIPAKVYPFLEKGNRNEWFDNLKTLPNTVSLPSVPQCFDWNIFKGVLLLSSLLFFSPNPA